jgi:hypothetical protein
MAAILFGQAFTTVFAITMADLLKTRCNCRPEMSCQLIARDAGRFAIVPQSCGQ